MNRKLIPFLVMITALVMSSLACQTLFGGQVFQFTPPGEAVQVTEVVQVTQPVLDSPPVISGVAPLDDSLVNIYDLVNPGVVSIRVSSLTGGGQGSGFVIDKEGHIVTNYHVVENAEQVEIDFPSGLKVYGEVLGADLDSDLAVIKVDVPADALFPLSLGDSDAIKIGQTVIAIGNPFGLSGTMTIGIISGKGRTLDSLREAPGGDYFTSGDVLQTDAAINPGNSGGPLLNLKGEVIGVNRAIRTGNFTAEGEPTNSGIGFAVSSNIVKRVTPSLIAEGKYDYPYLGVTGLPEITLAVQEELGISQTDGVYVTFVEAAGPAGRAGIRQGDLLVAVDGKPIRVFGDMIGYLFNNKSPGDSIVFDVLRGGRQIQITVELGERP